MTVGLEKSHRILSGMNVKFVVNPPDAFSAPVFREIERLLAISLNLNPSLNPATKHIPYPLGNWSALPRLSNE